MNSFKQISRRFKDNYKRRCELLKDKGVLAYIFNSGGYVLVTVLIITTLLMTISGDFIIVSLTSLRYMKKFDDRTKAVFYAKSGMMLAEEILTLDNRGMGNMFSKSLGIAANKNTDSYFDDWAQGFPPAGLPLPLENFSLRVKIMDESSKINIGAFADKHGSDPSLYYHMAAALLEDMGFESDYPEIILDWVDPDDSRSPYGAESGDYYQTLTPAYFAKNGPMDSIDELLLLKNFTPRIFYGLGGGNYGMEGVLVDNNKGENSLLSILPENLTGSDIQDDDAGSGSIDIAREKSRRLSDYFRVCGSPQNYSDRILNPININTAPYRVLYSLRGLSDQVTEDVVWQIINKRKNEPLNSTSQIKEFFENDTANEVMSKIEKVLAVQSNIFKIVTVTEVNNTKLQITGYYNRGRSGSPHYLYWCEE